MAGQGRPQDNVGRKTPPSIWLIHHLQTAVGGLGRIARAPLSTLMTALVIGITLALPTGLYLVLTHVQQLQERWDLTSNLTLFLSLETTPDQAQGLAERLRARSDVQMVRLSTPEDSFTEFKAFSGFREALELLDENPLPSLIHVSPAVTHASPDAVDALVQELSRLPEVQIAQIDMGWLRRVYGIIAVAERVVLLLAVLFGVAVALIIGNTIRLEIRTRQTEIEITKLVGGTDGFIRRPFLYLGIWYGVAGGIIAWLTLTTGVLFLAGPVERLAALYGSDFSLHTLDLQSLGILLSSGVGLGLVGAWLAVGRHLAAIRPV